MREVCMYFINYRSSINSLIILIIASCVSAEKPQEFMSQSELSSIYKACPQDMDCVSNKFLSAERAPAVDAILEPPKDQQQTVSAQLLQKLGEAYVAYDVTMPKGPRATVLVAKKDDQDFFETYNNDKPAKVALLRGNIFLYVPDKATKDWKQNEYNKVLSKVNAFETDLENER